MYAECPYWKFVFFEFKEEKCYNMIDKAKNNLAAKNILNLYSIEKMNSNKYYQLIMIS